MSMIVLGLLVLLAAVGLTLDVAWQNTSFIRVDALGQAFVVSPGWTFIIGAAAGLVGAVGLLMLLSGLVRARRRRQAMRESLGSTEELRAELDRLAIELEAEKGARAEAEGGRRVVDLTQAEVGAESDRAMGRGTERSANRSAAVEQSLQEAGPAPHGVVGRMRTR
jgi:hypothetical protein